MATLTIGRLARAASVNIQTVRYYERRGLVDAPRRTTSGYRQYPTEVVARLRFIKHAQALGFSLREIQELLALRVKPGASCQTAARRTREKIAVVTDRISHLERIRHALEDLARACDACQPTDPCPILRTLDDPDA